MEPVDPASASRASDAGAFRLVDDQGRVRAQLSLDAAAPTLAFFDEQQRVRLQMRVGADGNPQVLLFNGTDTQPQLKVEGDAAGSHVLLSGAGEQKTYLFLKATGATGLVMFNADGGRQAEWMLTPQREPGWSLWRTDGSLKASSESPERNDAA